MLYTLEDQDMGSDLLDPFESLGIAVSVTEIPALRREQTAGSLGLAGHQPNEKMASSRFNERPRFKRRWSVVELDILWVCTCIDMGTCIHMCV